MSHPPQPPFEVFPPTYRSPGTLRRQSSSRTHVVPVQIQPGMSRVPGSDLPGSLPPVGVHSTLGSFGRGVGERFLRCRLGFSLSTSPPGR